MIRKEIEKVDEKVQVDDGRKYSVKDLKISIPEADKSKTEVKPKKKENKANVSAEEAKAKTSEESTENNGTSNFWGKLGGWVKEKVDCCLE
jgi:hypothetical protein